MFPDPLPDERYREGSITRGWRDGSNLVSQWWMGGVLGAAGGAALGLYLSRATGDKGDLPYLYAAAGAVGGLLVAAAIGITIGVARAPYRQRDEARTAREQRNRFLAGQERWPIQRVKDELRKDLASGESLLPRLTVDRDDDPTAFDSLVDECHAWVIDALVPIERSYEEWRNAFNQAGGVQHPRMASPLTAERLRTWLSPKLAVLRNLIGDAEDGR